MSVKSVAEQYQLAIFVIDVCIVLCYMCVVWCLFELYCALEVDAEVIMCFTEDDATAFYKKLTDGGANAALMPKIDAASAEASQPQDKEMIFAQINRGTGMGGFNSQLQAFMEHSLQAVAANFLVSKGGFSCAAMGKRGGRAVGVGGINAGALYALHDRFDSIECAQELQSAQSVATDKAVGVLSAATDQAFGELRDEVHELSTKLDRILTALAPP